MAETKKEQKRQGRQPFPNQSIEKFRQQQAEDQSKNVTKKTTDARTYVPDLGSHNFTKLSLLPVQYKGTQEIEVRDKGLDAEDIQEAFDYTAWS